jgi:DNA replication and repair protein RecF
MYVQSLRLMNFRNYKDLDVAFSSHVNLLLGDNAQGKTNAVEAIEFLALAKSHRTSRDSELIHWGAENAQIVANVSRRQSSYCLEMAIAKKGKKIKVNGFPVTRTSEYIGLIHVVVFSPEDLQLVKGGPPLRRRFLDIELGQVSPVYLHALSQYQKILTQRNNLLKEFSRSGKVDQDLLEVWDDQLVLHGTEIIKKRSEFLQRLQSAARLIHFQISGGKEELGLRYIATAGLDCYKDQLREAVSTDIFRGNTSVGPHRDDFAIRLDDIPVSTYGSQGQQRTVALSLKLAEVDFIYQEVGEYPILILDDVLSELDENRQNHLVRTVGQTIQTFITATSKEGISGLPSGTAVFYVSGGKILRKGGVV